MLTTIFVYPSPLLSTLFRSCRFLDDRSERHVAAASDARAYRTLKLRPLRCQIHVTYLRLILIGERFFHNFQGLEIIGDMYQYTEAFFHYS